jgi:DNA-binding transcriptional LysR family regulator
MNWDTIATIAAVVRAKSLLGAAKELGIQHSSVSRRISAIEAELEEPLFVRGRRLTPTRLALEIEAHAESMATAAQRLTAALAARKARRESELAITTSDALAPLLVRAIARVKNAPRVRLLVSDEERELEAGSVDVALRPTGAPRASLRGRRLGVLAAGVYRRRGAHETHDGWLVASEEMQRRASLTWLRRVPSGARITLECDRLLALRDACVAGLGRAILPCFLAIDDARLERSSLLDEGTPLWLFVATSARTDPAQRAFLEQLTRGLKSEKAAWQAGTCTPT